MKEGSTDFLDEFAAEEATAEPALQIAETVDAEPQGQPRGADGKFAAKGEQVEKGDKQPEQVTAPEPEPPSEHEGKTVPVSALKAEREKRQALEAELAKLRAPQTQQPQPTPSTPKAPDFSPLDVDFEEDPATHLFQTKMQLSTFMAEQTASPQEVAEAWSAFDEATTSDPILAQYSHQLRNHPHPMGEVLKWHRKQRDLRMIEEAGGLEKIIEQRLAAMQEASPAAPTMQASPAQRAQPVATPPSLTRGAGNATAPQTPDEDDVFDAMFGGPKTRKR